MIFIIGFVVILADGAALIWLGQLSGNRPMVLAGLSLVATAAFLTVLYRRWMRTLDDVDDMRRDLRREVDRLRDAVDAARGGRRPED